MPAHSAEGTNVMLKTDRTHGRISFVLLALGVSTVCGAGALGVPPDAVRSLGLIDADPQPTSDHFLDPKGSWPRRGDATLMAEVGGSGGDNCHLASATQLTVGASGSPNTVIVNGDSSTATPDPCIGGPWDIWWEAFEIDKCANVTLDFCGTSPTLSLLFSSVAAGCAVDGSSCGPFFGSNAFSRSLCDGEGASGNATITYNALPAGTYYYPIIADPAGPYVMNITAEECSGACTGCLGACCDSTAETCVNDVAQDQCAGGQEKWAPRSPCCAVECRDPAGPEYDALDVELLSRVSLDDMSSSGANDIWAYTSPGGRKYAIVGLIEATAFVDVTHPRSPVLVATIPDASSIWSDMATYKTFAYNVNETGGGMQIIDLGDIDNGIVTLIGVATGGMTKAHNVFVNEESGYAYPCLTDVDQGFLVFDLANPANPVRVGSWNEVRVHDLYVRSFDACPWAGRAGQPCELAYAFCEGSGMYIVDVTDKSNMTTLSTLTYPTLRYCHQGWLSEDGRYVFFNDEGDERGGLVSQTRTYVADVQDPASPSLAATFDHDGCWIDHNLIPKGDRVYQAHYTAGLRVLDVQNPLLPVEVAYFDTHPEDSSTNFFGAWGVHVGLPSRIVLISDIERGLFVLCDQTSIPLPSFVVPGGRGTAQSPLGFDAGSSTTCETVRSIASYEWDFDYNGTTFKVEATGVAPDHTFTAVGTFVVALRITDDLGAQAETTLEITIDPPIPTVSQWGLVVMMLLTLAAGAAIVVRRRSESIVQPSGS